MMRFLHSLNAWRQTTLGKLTIALGLLLVLLLAYGLGRRHHSSGLTQVTKTSTQKTQQKRQVVQKARTQQQRQSREETVHTKRYDRQTGRLVSETIRQNKQHTDTHTRTTQQVVSQQAVKQAQTSEFEPAPTGVTAGVLALPSGVGVAAGVTLIELAPVNLGVQAGLLAYPQVAPVLGLTLNGTIAPRLTAGVGAFVGPQTGLGYTPVVGVPVTLQPGLIVQYRF